MKSHSKLPKSSPRQLLGKIGEISADANGITQETSKSFSSLLLAILTMVSSIYLVLRYGLGVFSRQWGHGGDFVFLLTLAFGVLGLLLSCMLFYLFFNSSKQRRAKGEQ